MNTIQYLNFKQICEKYPFSQGQLKYFLSRRFTNGFSNCVRKIGKRLYFRVDLLDEWIEERKVKEIKHD